MKMYVPEVGDVIRLTADWTFDLYNEDRNYSLMEFVGDPRKRNYSDRNKNHPCTIPAGAELKIDRVYIRKGLSEFSSLSFLWVGAAVPAKMQEITAYDWKNQKEIPTGKFHKAPRKPVRFWAKLSDVNKIDFEPV